MKGGGGWLAKKQCKFIRDKNNDTREEEIYNILYPPGLLGTIYVSPFYSHFWWWFSCSPGGICDRCPEKISQENDPWRLNWHWGKSEVVSLKRWFGQAGLNTLHYTLQRPIRTMDCPCKGLIATLLTLRWAKACHGSPLVFTHAVKYTCESVLFWTCESC